VLGEEAGDSSEIKVGASGITTPAGLTVIPLSWDTQDCIMGIKSKVSLRNPLDVNLIRTHT
jgi:hypothetical protein